MKRLGPSAISEIKEKKWQKPGVQKSDGRTSTTLLLLFKENSERT